MGDFTKSIKGDFKFYYRFLDIIFYSFLVVSIVVLIRSFLVGGYALNIFSLAMFVFTYFMRSHLSKQNKVVKVVVDFVTVFFFNGNHEINEKCVGLKNVKLKLQKHKGSHDTRYSLLLFCKGHEYVFYQNSDLWSKKEIFQIKKMFDDVKLGNRPGGIDQS